MATADALIELRLAPAERLDGPARQVTEALERARAARCGAVLVIVPPGAAPKPTAAERVALARTWAAAAAGRVRLALVSEPELLDGDRLGVVVAHAFGMQGEVFTDEAEARRWLREAAP